MPRITKAQKIKKIQELKEEMATMAHQEFGDPESAHCRADDILCEMLLLLGHKDTVEDFNSLQKWYA